MMKIIGRYKLFLALLLINILLLFLKPSIGINSMVLTMANLRQMLIVIPPIFLLLGILDIWVSKETMIKLMGKDSGLMGMAVAFILGAFSAGPLYAAFPIAGILMKKGSRFLNVLIFIGAWSTTKVPLLLFEVSTMGWKFMITRFIIDLFGIVLIAYLTEKIVISGEKEIL